MQYIFFNEPWNEQYEKQKTTPMICKKCKIEMKHMTGNQNGGYHICIECNNVVITGEISNEKLGKQNNQ